MFKISIVAVLLIVSLAGVYAFGFSGMNHASGHSSGCLAVITQGVDCPTGLGALDFISFHLNALGSFMAVTLSGFYSIALSVLLILFVFSYDFSSGVFEDSRFANPRTGDRLPPYFFRKRINSWLSLHENSPTYAF